MGAHGELSGPLETYGDLWVPMGIGTFGDLWRGLGTYGDLQEPMGTCGDFFRIMVVWIFPAFPCWLHLFQPLYFFFHGWGASTFCTPFLTTPPPFLQA